METLSDGNTILVYEESTSHPENLDDVVHIRFSDDGGATWTAEDTDLNGNPVAGFPAYPDAGAEDPEGPGDTYIFQAPNGDVYLHTWKANYTAPISMHGTWRIKSTDGGITWGAWEQIHFTGQSLVEDDYSGMTEQHFILGDTIYMVGRVYGTIYSTVKMCLYKSEDNGATWAWVSDMSVYTDGTHEAAAEYIGDNKIIVYHRDVSNAISRRQQSDDLGATWGPLYRVESSINVIGRNRMFTDAHLKGEANWWTDTHLIMCGFVLTSPGTSHPRRNAIWLSANAGATWTKPIYLDDAAEDGGYGDLTYDGATDTYRVVTYKGSMAEANLMQYSFKVNW